MAPKDHNKTISIAYSLIGMIILIALLFIAISEIREHHSNEFNSPTTQEQVSGNLLRMVKKAGETIYFLPFPILQLLTAYGLFRKRRWARIIALIFSVLYIWIFPLGTGLAIYTWWFLQSANGKQLYAEA